MIDNKSVDLLLFQLVSRLLSKTIYIFCLLETINLKIVRLIVKNKCDGATGSNSIDLFEWLCKRLLQAV